MKYIWILVIGLALIIEAFQIRAVLAPSVIEVGNNVFGVENAPEAQNTQITAYLDRLSSMENCGEGIVDENGLISKGDLCFQKSTYLYFVKKYELYPYAEEHELLSNWGDSWTQREITKRMIEEEVGQLKKHWYTSVVVRGLGLPKL